MTLKLCPICSSSPLLFADTRRVRAWKENAFDCKVAPMRASAELASSLIAGFDAGAAWALVWPIPARPIAALASKLAINAALLGFTIYPPISGSSVRFAANALVEPCYREYSEGP